MRINVDSHFFGDKRVGRLAALCKESHLTSIGRLLQVYHYQYTQRRVTASAEELDLHAEWMGTPCFGELMTQAQLARRLSEGTFEVRGVRDRIEFLNSASEAGKKSVETRRKMWGTAQPGKGPPNVPSEVVPDLSKVSEPLTLPLSQSQDQELSKSEIENRLKALYKAHFPRKSGPGKGIQTLLRTVKTEGDLIDVETSMRRFAKEYARTEATFIPHFKTYAGHWRDPLEPDWAPNGKAGDTRLVREVPF